MGWGSSAWNGGLLHASSWSGESLNSGGWQLIPPVGQEAIPHLACSRALDPLAREQALRL